MIETAAKEKNMKQIWLNSFKICGKTLFVVSIIFFYIIATMFFLMPKFDAKIFNFLGLTKAEESCYLQSYEKSGSNVDLYNFILFLQENDLYEKELYYINVLMDSEGYDEFSARMNKSVLKNTSKDMYAYVGDVDSYLKSRKVKCMYALNLEKSYKSRSNSIIQYVRNELKSKTAYNTTFATFVNLVLNDNTLTKEQKADTFQTLENMYEIEDENDTALYLIEKENQLIKDASEEENESQKIILQKYLIDFLKSEYHFYSTLGVEDSVLNDYEEKYKTAQNIYQSLIK